ncbi:MAG TPA: TlpA disulfide reductase family protein [Bacillota bacterium]
MLFVAVSLPKAYLALFAAVAVVALTGVPLAGVQMDRAGRQALPAAALAGIDLTPPAVEIGKEAPDFTLESLDGQAVSLSAFRGRPVLLYFWATWCSYCTETLPQLNEVYSRYSNQGLEVLAIDILESRDRVARAVSGLGLSFPVLLDADARASKSYAVRATPTYVFIDRAGVVREILIGAPRPGAVEGRLLPILKPLEESL